MRAKTKLFLSALFLLGFTASHPAAAQILHVFTGGADGELPEGGVVTDSEGALYGTTAMAAMLVPSPAVKALSIS